MMVRQRTGSAVMIENWEGFRQLLNTNVWENIREPSYKPPIGERKELSPEHKEMIQESYNRFIKRFVDSPAYDTMSDEDFKAMKRGEKTEEQILKPTKKKAPEPVEKPLQATPVEKVKGVLKGRGRKSKK